MNHLYYGDNLAVLREEFADESVDLIYLDPPFNSQADYNVLFKEPGGQRSEAQIRAFADTWHWDHTAEAAFREALTFGNTDVSEVLRTLRGFLKENDMMAYLAMMAVRLLELHRVLKPTGSLYLHCDPTAGHYLKIILDAVFGKRNFLNEVIWSYDKWTNAATHFQRNHDVIFAYTRDRGQHTFNKLHNPDAPQKVHYERGYHTNVVQGGVRQLLVYDREKARNKIDSGGYDRIVYREGQTEVALSDVWRIPILNSQAKERLGYPTQKPLALLDRIISASSNPGDLVLDPFCGCGTAVHAAEKLGRRWAGIDITHLAISLIDKRLKDAFPGLGFAIHGTPKDLAGARALAAADKYQFQWWAVSLVEAMPFAGRKKGADGGIDGLIYFQSEARRVEKVIVSVKAGDAVGVDMIRSLRATMEREGAAMGLFLTLAEPTKPMRAEAAAAGAYTLGGRDYPRIQILTTQALLEGAARPDLPPTRVSPFRMAAREEGVEQASLL